MTNPLPSLTPDPPAHRDSWRLTAMTACKQCGSGEFCSSTNMTATGTSCTAGYFCSGGSPTSSPVNSTYGDLCPMGNACTLGSSAPTPCPVGQYQNRTGQATCQVYYVYMLLSALSTMYTCYY